MGRIHQIPNFVDIISQQELLESVFLQNKGIKKQKRRWDLDSRGLHNRTAKRRPHRWWREISQPNRCTRPEGQAAQMQVVHTALGERSGGKLNWQSSCSAGTTEEVDTSYTDLELNMVGGKQKRQWLAPKKIKKSHWNRWKITVVCMDWPQRTFT